MADARCLVDKLRSYCNVLRDESLEDLDSLPVPEIIAREIVEDLTAALVDFEAVAAALKAAVATADHMPAAPST